MKNVTISLSEDLVRIVDSICKDCDLSRYAFAKEALLEKIERHTTTESTEAKPEATHEDKEKPTNQESKDDESDSVSSFFKSLGLS